VITSDIDSSDEWRNDNSLINRISAVARRGRGRTNSQHFHLIDTTWRVRVNLCPLHKSHNTNEILGCYGSLSVLPRFLVPKIFLCISIKFKILEFILNSFGIVGHIQHRLYNISKQISHFTKTVSIKSIKRHRNSRSPLTAPLLL
jgi:hypothetical protein